MNSPTMTTEVAVSALLVGVLCFLVPTDAWAQFQGAEKTANSVLAFLTGPFAIAIATIGCAVCGYMAWAGRLRMETALRMILGILLIFAAPKIVATIVEYARG